MAFTECKPCERPLAAAALAAALLAAPLAAAAADAPAAGSPPRWYGWQLMLNDAAAAGAGYLGGDVENVPLGVGAGLLYLGVAPGIHLAHHQPGGALRSLGLRVGLPLAFGLVGYALDRDTRAELHGLGPLVGAGLGAGVAMVIDWAAAWEPASAGAAALAPPAAQPGDWSAGVAPTRGGARLAVAIAF